MLIAAPIRPWLSSYSAGESLDTAHPWHRCACPPHVTTAELISSICCHSYHPQLNSALGWLISQRSEDIFRMKGILAISGSPYRFVYQVSCALRVSLCSACVVVQQSVLPP